MKLVRHRSIPPRLIKTVMFVLVGLITLGILSGILMPSYSRAEVTQQTFKAVANTYLKRSDPSESFGGLMHVDIANEEIIGLLRFDVNELDSQTVAAANLRLSIMDGATKANVKVFAINSDWNEGSLTWKQRPTLSTQVGELPTTFIKKNDWIEVQLGQAIASNGTYSFALTTDSHDRVGFRSRSTEWSPELVLKLQNGAPSLLFEPQGSSQPATFTPEQISTDAPEIVNPMRGLYKWQGQEYAVQPDPALDAYERYTWRELEPTQGDYRFAVLEADIAKAAREGRKYSFRISTVVSTKGSSVPDYAMGGAGWWADYDEDGSVDTYVPDWNDPTFLSHLEKFMQALGQRYNGDPRIAFVDIGLYGNWGEWHMADFSYPSSTGAQRATAATKYRLIDMYIAVFPTTPLVMMTDDTEGLVYAMSRSPRIGWRRDSLGWKTGHFDDIKRDPVRWNAIKDRWQTAPVITEFVNPRYQDEPAFYQRALKQVQSYHVSLVGNGNTSKWSSISAAGKKAFLRLGKTAGYRIVLNKLSLPSYFSPGSTFDIATSWSNVGVAPVYEPWQVHIQLRKAGSSEVVWQTTSATDITKLLPNTPINQTDAVTLPNDIPKGQYDVVVVVQDPRQNRPPLALAITNVSTDGSYRLGTVAIR